MNDGYEHVKSQIILMDPLPIDQRSRTAANMVNLDAIDDSMQLIGDQQSQPKYLDIDGLIQHEVVKFPSRKWASSSGLESNSSKRGDAFKDAEFTSKHNSIPSQAERRHVDLTCISPGGETPSRMTRQVEKRHQGCGFANNSSLPTDSPGRESHLGRGFCNHRGYGFIKQTLFKINLNGDTPWIYHKQLIANDKLAKRGNTIKRLATNNRLAQQGGIVKGVKLVANIRLAKQGDIINGVELASNSSSRIDSPSKEIPSKEWSS
ncbi:hypothetical protein DH2020_012732 [Rehmannia glutinosa]|uniref:Uncharacterized protein n=1 Tax=Rehmannia glutinosa TaxID=99300 RepID=A0ABR0X1F5_REHGL